MGMKVRLYANGTFSPPESLFHNQDVYKRQGLGGGRTWGVYQKSFLYHYENSGGCCTTIFHELGHCLGSVSYTHLDPEQPLVNSSIRITVTAASWSPVTVNKTFN